jgi:hypothetical protein
MSNAPEDIQTVFDQLVHERGGRGSLSVVDLAVCRTLAIALADGDATGATALAALLPAKTEQAPLDLTLLSDKEFRQFEKCIHIAAGKVPPTPFRRPRPSRHAHDAALLVEVIDRAEKRGQLTDRDETEIRSLMCYMLRNLTPNVSAIWFPYRASPEHQAVVPRGLR